MIQPVFRHTLSQICVLIAAIALFVLDGGSAFAQSLIRTKRPDRGVYQPPTIGIDQVRKVTIAPVRRDSDLAGVGLESNLVPAPMEQVEPADATNYEATGDSDDTLDEAEEVVLPEPVRMERAQKHQPTLQKVGYEQVARELKPFDPPYESETQAGTGARGGERVQACSCESCSHPAIASSTMMYQGTDSMGVGCDSGCYDGSCDSMGCDSIGCGSGLSSKQWFGSLELMLMFRQGDRLPALVTSGPSNDLDTAGEIGQAGTVVVAGEEKILRDMTAGGRLTIGMWLDRYKDRSLVGRGWFAGEQTFGFSANQNSRAVIARPFTNFTNDAAGVSDTLVIAFPDVATGEISVQADTNVYGGDLSIRQLWCKQFGGTIDLLYGYQYMGLDESLSIASRSTSLDDNVRPVGSMISIRDSFDIENQFHGGQVGVATNYREGCWSFSSLVKIGFGAIERKATLRGSTTNSIDGDNSTTNEGLLVRSTNSGTHRDRTFGWVPEMDFTLGWQKYPSFDVTFGYHVVVMTDALQLSGVVDTRSNLAETGTAVPSAQFSYDAYYVHGLHFGLSYIY